MPVCGSLTLEIAAVSCCTRHRPASLGAFISSACAGPPSSVGAMLGCQRTDPAQRCQGSCAPLLARQQQPDRSCSAARVPGGRCVTTAGAAWQRSSGAAGSAMAGGRGSVLARGAGRGRPCPAQVWGRVRVLGTACLGRVQARARGRRHRRAAIAQAPSRRSSLALAPPLEQRAPLRCAARRACKRPRNSASGRANAASADPARQLDT